MQKYSFTVYGKPQHKRRVRIGRAGNFTRTYKDNDEINAETTIQAVSISSKPRSPLVGALKCEIRAFFPVPVSASKAKKAQMLSGEILPTVKPDCDNIEKIYLDSLNGIYFLDDKQVVDIHTKKLYSETPRVEFSVWEIQLDNDGQI